MQLKSLILEDFRSYMKREFQLGEGVTALVGPNAIGKTNVLEAIRLLSLGDSFRAEVIAEMVRFGEEMGRVEALVDEDNEHDKLTVIVTGGEVGGRKVSGRRFLVNDVPKSKANFVGLLPSVVFLPEDLELMDGSPSLRRKWFDSVLQQTDAEYRRSLASYEKALRRRNRVLQAIREGLANRYQLTFWDGLVIKHGEVLTEKREELVQFINAMFSRSDLFAELALEYDKSVISESRLNQYEKEEVLAGHTLVGPHKDDFVVTSAHGSERRRNLATYGSRGEKRMAVLGLKMGELLLLEEKLGKKPLLLLDDIFSELDKTHSEEVHRVMLGRQVIVTTTDGSDLSNIGSLKVIELG